jgi:hypothetical protein
MLEKNTFHSDKYNYLFWKFNKRMSKSVDPQVYFESDLQASRLQPEEEKFQSQ